MEMELKTLKEIEGTIEVKTYDDRHHSFNGSIQQQFLTNEWVKREDLKQEAIKWIKDIYFKDWQWDYLINLKTGKEKKYKLYMKKEYNEVANWIKHFFNITEEDLK